MLQSSDTENALLALEPSVLGAFAAELASPDLISNLRKGLVGEGSPIPGPFGSKPLIYADYAASGRAIDFMENFILREILPFYANSHTEGSYCGAFITGARRIARNIVAEAVGATDDYAVIFAGSGATTAVNRLVHMLDIHKAVSAGERPLVLVGPYEHHSNILPWRETGAEVIEILESPEGGVDTHVLEQELKRADGRKLVIGAFSACSNVTGIVADVKSVTRLLKRHGALAVWDYAGGAPYIPIDLAAGTDAEIDALFLSSHKFVGGPGASGILCVRKACVVAARPALPGGGTVSYVSPWGHDYVDDITEREEGGTPNVLGDIRAAMSFQIKEAVGLDYIHAREQELVQRAMARWSKVDGIEVLGNLTAQRLPIFSILVRDLRQSGFVHHNLATRILSDYFGIQARGGCACAGPYGHRLLSVDFAKSNEFREVIRCGDAVQKPGWTRLNLNYLLDDETVDFIIEAVAKLPEIAATHGGHYQVNPSNAQFGYVGGP